MSTVPSDPAELIRAAVDRSPALAERLARHLMVLLHAKGLASIDEIYDQARAEAGAAPRVREEEDPNSPGTPGLEADEMDAVRLVTFRLAARHLSSSELEEAISLTRRREAMQSLEGIASLPDVPFRVLADAVKRFCALPRGEAPLPRNEVLGTRVALVRNFISDQLEFLGVAKNHLRIIDFEWIVDRVIGPERGRGRIGGKAAGMFLGYRILQGDGGADPGVRLPESWFLRSDVIREFMRHNGLDEYQSQKYKPAETIRAEYPVVRQVFRSAQFPDEIVARLDRLLEQMGEHPLVVRSSSLLEDRFGAAFSGMYASIFLGNQGPRRHRLRALLGAIAEVFASTLGPDPILYRRRHRLIDYDEDMGVLIQKVVGRRHGPFHLPDVAGVAFSRNELRWSPRIRVEDGMARVVLGLGTRAVDRTGNDYPRIIALGAPGLRPSTVPAEVRSRSQSQVDAIDLSENRFRTVPLQDLLAAGPGTPGLDLAASLWTGDAVIEPVGSLAGESADRICLTFDRLATRTSFARDLRDRLRRLEDAYGVPINLEFAVVEDSFYLLQCRPLVQVAQGERGRIPRDLPPDRVVFTSKGMVRSGEVPDISEIVLVDPWAYDAIDSIEVRHALARAVGRVNDALEGRTFILMGPGRWGSNDSRLGVRVTYADVRHCSVLAEIALRKGSFVPELSYGTHFFQDLVEEGIYYLALYPDDAGSVFRETFFRDAPNALGSLVPQDRELEPYLKVIRVRDAAPGLSLHLSMDGDAGEALCWLE